MLHSSGRGTARCPLSTVEGIEIHFHILGVQHLDFQGRTLQSIHEYSASGFRSRQWSEVLRALPATQSLQGAKSTHEL